MSNNLFPVKDSDFLVWSQNFAKTIKTYIQLLKLDSKKVDEIQTLANKFKSNLEKSKDPERTHMDVVHKNDSKKELGRCIRYFVGAYLNYNLEMNTIIWNAIGIHPKSSLRNQAQKLTSKPKLELRPGIRMVTVRYMNEVNHKVAKPKGARGIIYHWALLNEPPESPESFTMAKSVSSGPLVLEFNENQRGKTLYISARWENSRGEPGPWSDIVKTYVA